MPASLDESYNLPSKLENIIDEIGDIKFAWEFVGSIYQEIEEIGRHRFNLFNTDSLNELFHTIIENLKSKTSIKAFDCVIECQTKVNFLVKMNSTINELRGEIFKDRHWKALFFRLNVNHSISTLTISQFWSLDLIKNKGIFMEILNTAQGEHGLENYITSINDHWSGAVFNFIPFKTKFEIINNWQEIILKLGNHSSGLESMKASPYYQGFSVQAEQWQERILFLLELCETWSGVQRKWLYLFGIFYESTDIKKLLGPESVKYIITTNEFSNIMKKVSKDPFVLNIFKISDMIGSFNKLFENLTNIQKALTKYLEQERENFPRFYFVGDDDLLEILGNCNDVGNIQKHLKKMFPGIYGLIFDINNSKIIGVSSKDDEKLIFHGSFDIASCTNIIECLKLVETTVYTTLAHLLMCSYTELTELSRNLINDKIYLKWIKKYPQQLIILSEKIVWCEEIERVLGCSEATQEKVILLKLCLSKIESRLDILPKLIQKNDHPEQNSRIIRIADSCFFYAFEYLGLVDYIIQTPLIDNCFLVMTQALKMRLGGSPFGPAGTGKTESVKALGAHLGRFVIVFNCDKNFDFQAMGRIFIGLCRVGAWGCFDEFNRLEERIISAVSQQIHSIQAGLKNTDTACQSKTETLIEILGKKIPININIAIFITMNPGYTGRSRLPNNLTRLFRSFSMTQPDRKLIAQVILYSQGFSAAENLSLKIVPLLKLCNEQLSQQPHYDFGLRALKTILVSAGNIKRKAVTRSDVVKLEQELIVQSIIQSILPKLTAEDTVLFLSITEDIFPAARIKESESENLIVQIKKLCDKMALQCITDSGENSSWLNKLIYLHNIIDVNHGIILVGESCTGKTTCWKVLLQALEEMDGIHGHSYVIDPKAVSKETLYGTLDPNTRVWTDGIFTAIIRNVIENSENHHQRHWIVFDGDIDPEWVENLNSTLDDNKLFTLPNGERLCLAPNIRILFEVSDLKYATPATISRCGMIFFSESTISIDMVMNHYFETLKSYNLHSETKDNPFNDVFNFHKSEKYYINENQTKIVEQIQKILASDKLMQEILTYCQNHLQHCMEFNFIRSLQSMFILFAKSIREIYDSMFTLNENNLEIIHHLVLYSLVWGFSGDCSHLDRLKFCQFLCEVSININLISSQILLQNYFTFERGFKQWDQFVSTLNTISISKISKSNFLVPTHETARNSIILSDAVLENRFIILCGPPGCGKSMLIHNIKALLLSWDILTIHFSSTTTADDLLRYILQGCEYRKGAHSQILCPKNGKNLIIFCDELNLSQQDEYGTQSAICLLRQLLELKGFYRKDRFWVRLEKIRFVASCSPPTYVGRKKLMGKFLKHAFIFYIDYPSNECLFKIFTTLNTLPQLKNDRPLSDKITNIMIELYYFAKEIFTTDICAHYIFTPRDLTLWVQGIIELTRLKINLSIQDVVEALFYEGLAVFSDRLIEHNERDLILCKHQGHLMLVGKNGSGRKTIVEFVASILDVFVFKARWYSSYSLSDFDQEIRNILKRIVTKNQQVFFIVDEASHLPPLFFERVNVLLSTGDLSDLYQGEKYVSLFSILREASSRNEILLGDSEELYQWFLDRIKSNLHFIFIFNNNLSEWTQKIGAHPSLFKNCVIKWCGDLTILSFCQIAIQLTHTIDLSFAEYNVDSFNYICSDSLNVPSLINSVVHSLASIHLCFSNILKFSYTNTPCAQHYMLFINQFKNILNEKLNSIEEEHSHISAGLLKLEQTFSEVALMKEELSSKQKELEIKNLKASQKLSEMASEQQKAQITREEAIKLFEQVKIQSEQIFLKSNDIKVELLQVEPAMEEAKESLSVIDRGKLNEIKVMYNPNQLIRLAISSVFELITGGCSENWKTVKSFLNRDDFINTVRNYKTENITPERRLTMNKFLENERYTPEIIARGSTACSPLVKWVRAHLSYFDILIKIDPLRLELSNLEAERETKEKQANELQSKINELEAKIDEYKQILCQTERKLSISSSILTNLELEQKRWVASHHTFQQKKNNLVGNCLLSAAFIVYFGNFDTKTRDLLWNTWIDILRAVNISFDENLLRVEYMTTPNERMLWCNLGLPSEYLCLENATILKYSQRFSFIIDPSGQASQFLNNLYMDRKAITTSFLNSSFKKELESSTRFGNIIIVTNAEFYDPSINCLIECNSNCDRKTVNIGGTRINVSPSFKMFLITADPTYSLPVNLGSRMCITNFTVTFSGLESQCLYKIFKNERPDLEEKRMELTKMQGEYNLRLYNLQKKLLSVLNEAQGGLLDDDRIISTLKQLNEQSIEISSKVEDSKNHLVVVNSSLHFYQPFATICSLLYFLLQDLHALNNFYHYSLKFFFDIFNSVFAEVSPCSNNDDTIHLDTLVIVLLRKLVERVIYGLLQKDKQLFLIVLSRIYLKYLPNSQILIDSIDFLIKNPSITITDENYIKFPLFSYDCNTSLNKLLTLKQFSSSATKIDCFSTELIDWAKGSKINSLCPKVWSDIPDTNENLLESLSSLLLCYILSPNDSIFFFEKFLNNIFDDQLLKFYYSQLDLKKVILQENTFETPILLLSVSGYDPTSWIDDIVADEPEIQLKVVAMGSSESCLYAENELNECSKSGKWLVLKNIHLASHWIKDLEKKLADLKANPKFRLLLTAEILSNLPASLLRSSRFITFEPPPGIKSCMLRTFNIISKSRFQKKPKERSKVYFLLAWLHAVIIERLDYLNLGWTKAYDFSESDLRVAFDMVDSWIDQVGGNRSNLPPEKMPWEAMTSLICLSIYGCYIENVFDSVYLKF
ncbi:hypothetical protein MXB_4461 [Myxobolus squamalis]|nr:hypothetical protein MXB_4461 [Myxobolus squamalis]